MRPEKVSKHLKYTFDDDEIKALSYDLARDTRELRSLNEAKKEVMADFTGKIKAKEGSTDRTSEQIANGYEYRMISCEIEYDSPKLGEKTMIRTDSGESWVEDMSESEKQGELFRE